MGTKVSKIKQKYLDLERSIENQAEILGFGTHRSVADQIGRKTAVRQRVTLGRSDRAFRIERLF